MSVTVKGVVSAEQGLDGKTPTPFVLVGTPEFRNGELVGFELAADYHFYRDRDHIVACSRPVTDREKYPNWPQPEPVGDG